MILPPAPSSPPRGSERGETTAGTGVGAASAGDRDFGGGDSGADAATAEADAGFDAVAAGADDGFEATAAGADELPGGGLDGRGGTAGSLDFPGVALVLGSRGCKVAG